MEVRGIDLNDATIASREEIFSINHFVIIERF